MKIDINWDVDIDKLSEEEAKNIKILATVYDNPLNLSLYQIKQYIKNIKSNSSITKKEE